jgi:hypothetical protein
MASRHLYGRRTSDTSNDSPNPFDVKTAINDAKDKIKRMVEPLVDKFQQVKDCLSEPFSEACQPLVGN